MAIVCAELLSTGSCSKPACTSNHDVQICRPCGVVCYTTHVYQAHLRGARHINTIAGRSKIYHCPICVINIPATGWQEHVAGKRHRSAAKALGVNPEVDPEEQAMLPDQNFCNACSINVPLNKWEFHLRTRAHAKKVLFTTFEAAFDEAERNKHGVVVSHAEGGLDFGFVEVDNAQPGVQAYISVENTVPLARINLVGVKMATTLRRRASPFTITPPAHPGLVHKRPLMIQATFRHSFRGRYQGRIEFTFFDIALGRTFIIVRDIKCTVGNQDEYNSLAPKAPYVPRKRTDRTAETNVVPGIPPPASNAVPYVVKLPHANIPTRISAALMQGSVTRQADQIRASVLPPIVNNGTHGRFYSVLLWVEEFRMEHDLEMYDITNAPLRKYGRYYYLEVPGLAEKRPSVLVGDRIFVQRSGENNGRWYEGHVHVVRKVEVGLCFHDSFSTEFNANRGYDVRFKLNRIPLRRQHQALGTVFDPDRILFPQEQHFIDGVLPIRVLNAIYNKVIIGNPPQMQAIASIVQQQPGSPPFVIFGPPGTGKTITVIESIRQILRVNANARILACAPSNSAADLITSRLKMLGPQKLFRFYAPSRSPDDILDDLCPFTHKTPDGHLSCPPVATLKRYQVVVSTCVSASFLYGVGIPRGHYTHMFFDEAGQATEPEIMVAIRTTADNKTNVVLSGDPKQLGPIVRSAVARTLGLEKSYLERMMDRPCYEPHAWHGISVVKLIQNFRSHPAILRFSDERFYEGELQARGSSSVINSLLGSPVLVNKKFPIVMHAISGKDDREASSPSFFNIDEVLQVKSYVQALRSDRRFRITDADIGVIAPYHAQCLKIRTALRSVADSVKVGSVEEFQGQERRVIIISTVRSSREYVEYDLRHTLGFVANPRRFNVAVTRAQALLIIVGDPDVLSLDPLWRSFLNYVHNNGGWTGNEPGWDTDAQVDEHAAYDQELRELAISDMNDFARRMEQLALDGVDSANAVDEGDNDANVDRPWREVE
ncbi:RNA helicase [Wolfiporia cocos MD-104 SS10]|uniref:RNA helicase n=1 Tax=Wolfiporia cocos (strain MD-104) TaxID=742152 RepID=A0A2H3JTA4_WOLCO|nr:RNA helicase [Wolfiporia cocos MD-104 SS10]